MTGNVADMIARLTSLVPKGWFARGNTPVFTALLTGSATALAYVYSLLSFVKLQTRILTATGFFVDLIAFDFFGLRFQRRPGEADSAFSARIITELFRPRVTRAGVIAAVQDLTGIAPVIFEPARVADTGAFETTPSSFVWGSDIADVTGIGGWGTLSMPAQFFITAKLPPGVGIGSVAGFTTQGAIVGMPGAFTTGSAGGVGSIEFVTISEIQGAVQASDIYAAIANTIAAGITAWTRIV